MHSQPAGQPRWQPFIADPFFERPENQYQPQFRPSAITPKTRKKPNHEPKPKRHIKMMREARLWERVHDDPGGAKGSDSEVMDDNNPVLILSSILFLIPRVCIMNLFLLLILLVCMMISFLILQGYTTILLLILQAHALSIPFPFLMLSLIPRVYALSIPFLILILSLILQVHTWSTLSPVRVISSMVIPLREIPVCMGVVYVGDLWRICQEKFERKGVAKGACVGAVLWNLGVGERGYRL